VAIINGDLASFLGLCNTPAADQLGVLSAGAQNIQKPWRLRRGCSSPACRHLSVLGLQPRGDGLRVRHPYSH